MLVLPTLISMTTPATVFISYAWESDAFRAQVKALRDYLLCNGVVVVSDFDHGIKPSELGWTTWMQQTIEDAAVVLVVCSASYRPRFEKRAPPTSGMGVAWEGAIITQDLYNTAQRNNKFYPIFPDPFNFEYCPKALQPWSCGHAFPSKQADVLALVQQCIGLPTSAVLAGASVAGAHGADPQNLHNPYNPWQPALAPRFFGREDVLYALHMTLDEKRSVSIVGDRRIGKSSLLLAWQTRAQGLGRVVCLVDGLHAGMTTCRGVVYAITGQTIATDDAESAANALEHWTAQLVVLPPLVLLDEAESVLEHLPHRFFERLRGLVGQGKICLVLATARPVDQVFKAVGRTSPFANLLEIKSLGLLDQAAAEHMLALGAGRLDQRCQALMRAWAGRHPFFLALCGRRLWDACASATPLEQVMDELNFEAQGRFNELWAMLTAREQLTLKKLAAGEAVSTTGTALRVRGLVVAGAQGDELFGEVLGLWLKNCE